ncbi:MAG TPA: hypothetical protein VN253_27825 [Kofleriaceae bacterium]|nr:hypothetical protein [Kofleriaceae bacterium]
MKKLLILAMISTCAVAGWRVLGGGGGDGATTHDDSKLALDRIWIDHMPKNERDQVSAFLAITDEPLGIFQTTSVWKGRFEMFRYEARGDELRIHYPQDNERERVKVNAHRCDEDDFDYCLELDGASRGVKRYYSRKGWEIDGATRPAELRARIEAAIQSH